MQLSTLTLCRNVINNLTLKVGADDFREVAPIVLSALADLDEAIREATTDSWPGMETPLTKAAEGVREARAGVREALALSKAAKG